jgi:cytochrome c-type biogenesis protein CcmE
MDAPSAQRRMLVRAGLAVTALVVVGAGVYLVLDAFTVGSVTFRFVDEVAGHQAELQGKRIQIAGAYVASSRTAAGPNKTSFTLEKNGARLTILADDGLLPNGFDVPGRDVVVNGMLDATGAFRASLVTTGCPSKYEARRR